MFKKLLSILSIAFGILTTQAVTNQVTVTWNPNPETNVVRYNVFRAEGANAPIKATVLAPATNLTSTAMLEGKTYTFSLTAENDLGIESDPSLPVVHYHPFLLPAISVTNVNVTKSGNEWLNVRLSWPDLDKVKYAHGAYTLFIENKLTGAIQQISTTNNTVTIPSLPIETYGLSVFTTNWHGLSPFVEKVLPKTPPQRPVLILKP